MINLVKPAYAQICNPILGVIGCGGEEQAGITIGNLISSLVGFALIIGTIGTLAFFILGALRWIGSGGDKNRLQAAQDEITHAIIGLIILVAAWAIFLLVTYFIGLGSQEGGGIQIKLPSLNQNEGQGGSSGNTGGQSNQEQQNQNTCSGTCEVFSCTSLNKSNASGSCSNSLYCCK